MAKVAGTGNSQNLNGVEGELHEVEEELHEFETKQSSITRTLQIIVYPAMVAFIVLAAYGFYLVQSLTTDVHRLTETIADMNQTVGTNMTTISGTMGYMSRQMDHMVVSTGVMSENMVGMTNSTQQMSANVQQMNASTQHMAASTYNMQNDLRGLNKGFKPLRMMSNFMPFGSDGGNNRSMPPPVPMRPPVAPAATTPYYGYTNYYTQPTMIAPQQEAGQEKATPVESEPEAVVGPSRPEQSPSAVSGDEGQSHQNQQVEKLAKTS